MDWIPVGRSLRGRPGRFWFILEGVSASQVPVCKDHLRVLLNPDSDSVGLGWSLGFQWAADADPWLHLQWEGCVIPTEASPRQPWRATELTGWGLDNQNLSTGLCRPRGSAEAQTEPSRAALTMGSSVPLEGWSVTAWPGVSLCAASSFHQLTLEWLPLPLSLLPALGGRKIGQRGWKRTMNQLVRKLQ